MCVYLVPSESDKRECLLASMGTAVGAVAVSQPYLHRYPHIFQKVHPNWLATFIKDFNFHNIQQSAPLVLIELGLPLPLGVHIFWYMVYCKHCSKWVFVL